MPVARVLKYLMFSLVPVNEIVMFWILFTVDSSRNIDWLVVGLEVSMSVSINLFVGCGFSIVVVVVSIRMFYIVLMSFFHYLAL